MLKLNDFANNTDLLWIPLNLFALWRLSKQLIWLWRLVGVCFV